LSIAALCVFDAVEFRAGHGMGTQLATALTNINEALYRQLVSVRLLPTRGGHPPADVARGVRSDGPRCHRLALYASGSDAVDALLALGITPR